MRFYLVSDNIDTKMGLRLAGIDGVVVHEDKEIEEVFDYISSASDIGIVLITEKLFIRCNLLINKIKEEKNIPIFVEIPDRHGVSESGKAVLDHVRNAIGIKTK